MDAHPLGDHAHHAMRDQAPRVAERRTRWVVLITLAMMVGELLVGWWSGSMALTADGWHMGTHAGALSLTALAYWFARTRANHDAFAFGTGKVYALAGFTSGLLLGLVALWMAVEGTLRLASPRQVDFGDAIWVAVLGLIVNLGCALLLGDSHDHGHGHGHDHGHGHAHDHGHGHAHGKTAQIPAKAAEHDHAHDDHHHAHDDHDHDHGHDDHDHAHDDHAPAREAAAPRLATSVTSPTVAKEPHAPSSTATAPSSTGTAAASSDHNLRAAYLHIVADAVTSVLAIAALLLGRYAGLWFADPAMGIIGGAVILVWAVGLCRQAGHQLLDVTTSPELETWVRTQLEAIDDVRVADLHVWEVGPGQHGCVVSLVTSTPRDVDHYRKALLSSTAIAHLTVEIHGCGRRHVAAA
jgi:cation diffusion facilitator family transporter